MGERKSMWQDELKKYIQLTGKEEMRILLQDESKLAKQFNLYTTNFNAEMLENLLVLKDYDHLNRRFSLERLEELYDLCISSEQQVFFMRCIDIMAYGSHVFRSFKKNRFEHPIFYMEKVEDNLIDSFENCRVYLDEISDCVDGEIQDKVMLASESLLYPLESVYPDYYQDVFLPQIKRALEQCQQKETLIMFRKFIEKQDLYMRGLKSSSYVLQEIVQELEEWADAWQPEYQVYSMICDLKNESEIYQDNSKLYSHQKELLNRYRQSHN